MLSVPEGLLNAVLGANLVVLFFVAWQLVHFSSDTVLDRPAGLQ